MGLQGMDFDSDKLLCSTTNMPMQNLNKSLSHKEIDEEDHVDSTIVSLFLMLFPHPKPDKNLLMDSLEKIIKDYSSVQDEQSSLEISTVQKLDMQKDSIDVA